MNNNAMYKAQKIIGDLGAELIDFAVAQDIKMEGSTSIHKRLMLATWINICGTESVKMENGQYSHHHPPVIFYETGFNIGLSAVAACEAVANCPGGGKVISFELDEKKRPVAEKLESMYPDILTVVWGDSNETVQRHFDSTGDAPQIFFADGAHCFNKTVKELEVAFSILKPGGFLFLDDTLDPVARKARDTFRSPECWIDIFHQTGLSVLQKGQPWA